MSTWTTHEIKLLKTSYPTMLIREIAPLIPRHTEASIASVAWRLVLRRKVHVLGSRKRWLAACAAHKPTFNFEAAE